MLQKCDGDRKTLLKEWANKKRKKEHTPIVRYYTLSNHDINFEFYESRKKAIVEDYATLSSKEDYNKAIDDMNIYKKKKVPFLFDIVVLNEAVLSAEDLITVRHGAFKRKEHEGDANRGAIDDIIVKDENGEPLINYLPNGHHNLTIGFGQRGQTALCHLFVDETGGKIDEELNFVPVPFYADVIDRDIDSQVAPFIVSHPSFVCTERGSEKKTKEAVYADLKDKYAAFDDFDEINRLMAFPTLYYRKLDYNSRLFLPLSRT